MEVARFAILILNKVIRSFTAKWHNNLESTESRQIFRDELKELRDGLINCKKELAKIAGIEDFVD